jgi:conjugative transfer region protein TrbK
MAMREQPDPVRLMIQLSAIAVLLAIVAPSVGSLRDMAIPSERLLTAEQQASVDEFARCRTMNPEQRPVDEACRRLWADNRRHFFGLDPEAGSALPAHTWTTCSQLSPDNGRADSARPPGSAVQKD